MKDQAVSAHTCPLDADSRAQPSPLHKRRLLLPQRSLDVSEYHDRGGDGDADSMIMIMRLEYYIMKGQRGP